MTIRTVLLFGFYVILIAFTSCTNKPAINTATLLSEMTNREVITEFPNPDYTTKQFSSYDRKSVAPDQPGWFANADRSQFIRIEQNEGRREFVMMDADGPGAIVRFWVTVADYGGNGILRIYIDNNSSPELEGEVLSLLSGGGIVDEPLAASVSDLTDYRQRGHNLYFPIAYAKHCKITYESDGLTEEPGGTSGEAFYYNINYRTYEGNVAMTSFSKEDLNTYSNEISAAQKELIKCKADLSEGTELHEKSPTQLNPGDAVSLDIEGAKAIKQLTVRLDAERFEQALRSTVLEITFDDEQTVWCPVGDFFGTGYKLCPYSTRYTSVTPDSLLACCWVMPFARSAQVVLKNYGMQPVDVKDFATNVSEYDWTNNSMHFGAGWFEQTRLESQRTETNEHGEDHGHFDVNYVTLSGEGVLMGNGVTLFNTIDAWWGEGDEKIYIDGEAVPSHIGTGTEDFYGYAWCRPEKFDHPYIAQPDGSGNLGPGHVVNLRYRGLDAIPFKKSLKFDLEMWHWLKTTINHAPVSYWYMKPGGKSNLEPVPDQVKSRVALTRLDLYLEGFESRNIFSQKTMVNIKGQENGYEIRYTLDGSTPDRNSLLYEKPFPLTKTAVVKAIGYTPEGHSTKILEGKFIDQTPWPATSLEAPKKGLKYDFYLLDDQLEATRQLKGYPVSSSGVMNQIGFPDIDLTDKFGLVIKGYVRVPQTGIYTFYTNTNDGSMLYVHDELIVNNDGGHGARERSGQIALSKGLHPIRIEYFQMGGGKLLESYMKGPGVEKRMMTPSELVH